MTRCSVLLLVVASLWGAIVVRNASAEDAPTAIWTDGGRGRFGPNDPITFGAIRALVDEAADGVVHIRVSTRGRGPFGGGDALQGEGSGFVVHADGFIVTNHHVIVDASVISVSLRDGTVLPATVVGSDARTDLALLRVDPPRPLRPLPLGRSGDLRVGDWLVAIGNPFGLEHTVTQGIVSALGRGEVAPSDADLFTDFIQTDASINPGNSGGPLLDMNGHVVGVATAINRAANNIGFAIPIDMVRALLPQLARGRVERSWLGVRLDELRGVAAEAVVPGSRFVARVAEVVPGGPAEQGGVEVGDVVVRFGDEVIDRPRELPWLASIVGVGRTVPLEVLRDGRRVRLEVTLEGLPGEVVASRASNWEGGAGFSVRELSPDVAARAGVADGAGVLVTRVAPTSAAARAGLRVGDVVLELAGQAVASVDAFAAYADRLTGGGTLQLTVLREGSLVFLRVPIP